MCLQRKWNFKKAEKSLLEMLLQHAKEREREIEREREGEFDRK